MERPYVLLSAAMSIDGYIDDASSRRLLLSNAADFDRVDGVRAEVDAILVGAGAVRADDPRLLVRSQARRQARLDAGRPASPLKVVICGSGRLEPSSQFFTAGDGEKIVYTSRAATVSRLGDLATVVVGSEPVDPHMVLSDLADRGVARLLVEGGEQVHTLFLAAGLVDELQLAVAPFLIGDSAAPRFVRDGVFPHTPAAPFRLAEVRQLGEVALLRYLTGSA